MNFRRVGSSSVSPKRIGSWLFAYSPKDLFSNNLELRTSISSSKANKALQRRNSITS